MVGVVVLIAPRPVCDNCTVNTLVDEPPPHCSQKINSYIDPGSTPVTYIQNSYMYYKPCIKTNQTQAYLGMEQIYFKLTKRFTNKMLETGISRKKCAYLLCAIKPNTYSWGKGKARKVISSIISIICSIMVYRRVDSYMSNKTCCRNGY